jgi:hypothetical protein
VWQAGRVRVMKAVTKYGSPHPSKGSPNSYRVIKTGSARQGDHFLQLQ